MLRQVQLDRVSSAILKRACLWQGVLKRGRPGDVRYRGDWMRRPIGSNEVRPALMQLPLDTAGLPEVLRLP